MITVPEEISKKMLEYNNLIDRCEEIKEEVTEWMSNTMQKYDISSVQSDELSPVFFQNTWCLPEALDGNIQFIDKWCPKIIEEPVIIEGEFREVEEAD